MMRHVFGVGMDEVMSWDEARYERHRAYAEAWLKAGGGRLGG